MAEYLVTMRERNKTTGEYDVLYPMTTTKNIKDSEKMPGARIVVTVTGDGAGQVVTLSGTETAIAVTNADGVATFDNLPYGNYTVSVESSTKNVTIDILKIYEIAFTAADTVLDNNSWDAISAISASGEAASYWSVGDTKTIVINGQVLGTKFSNVSYINAYILGFNHNADLEGNNRIHFCIGKRASNAVALVDSQYGYSTSSASWFSMSYSESRNSGGWKDCYMRSTVMPAIKDALPTELQSVLKTVTKYTDNVGGGVNNSLNITATTETICLEAEFEVHGIRRYANEYEQNKQLQYDYYKNGNSKVRYKYNDTGNAAFWWNRSPYFGDYKSFCNVATGGVSNYKNSWYSYAIAPCFFV